jgi:oxygen-independent coproporphyrinogen-3 oxidase
MKQAGFGALALTTSRAKPMQTSGNMRTEPCGVYVHVPFCRRRCPYCDFAFEVRPADARFAPAVVEEFFARRAELPHSPSTLSFGGGTPSSVSVDELAKIVEAVGAHDEVSLEVNPEDANADWKGAGFTRASLGVQSFDDDVLRYLGRAHDAASATRAIAACVKSGLSVGVDLIIGVPGERKDRLRDDVKRITDLGVSHVSAYVLTLEEGTPLVQLIAKKARAALDDDEQADAYERAQDLLPALGYSPYEISSYAKTGSESIHNRIYWQGGEYLGLGPSAHSMRIDVDGRIIRRATKARFDQWIENPRSPAHEIETLVGIHALKEAVAFGLRDLQAGVDIAERARVFHVDDASPIVRALAECGDDVRFEGGRAFLTKTGARFADRVARAVLAARP